MGHEHLLALSPMPFSEAMTEYGPMPGREHLQGEQGRIVPVIGLGEIRHLLHAPEEQADVVPVVDDEGARRIMAPAHLVEIDGDGVGIPDVSWPLSLSSATTASTSLFSLNGFFSASYSVRKLSGQPTAAST